MGAVGSWLSPQAYSKTKINSIWEDNVVIENSEVIAYCHSLKCGDKIKFSTEKQRYTVKAKNDRYLICTKPFNLIHHVLYTIIDLERFERGRNNIIFNPYDYMVQEDIDECLHDLETGEVDVSYRHCIPLDVVVDKTTV